MTIRSTSTATALAACLTALTLPAAADERILSRPYLEFCWGKGGDRITAFPGSGLVSWLSASRDERAAYLYDEQTDTWRVLPRSDDLGERLAARSCIQKKVVEELPR